MLKAYLDDSGTHKGSPVIVLGALVGTPAQWEKFEIDWKIKLNSPVPGKPPLKAFHLSHCRNKHGEFSSYNNAEEDLVTKEFRDIIIEADLISIACVVDLKSWDNLVTDDVEAAIGDPLQKYLAGCIDEIIKHAIVHPEGNEVSIIVDQGIKNEKLDDLLLKYTPPLGTPRIVSYKFAPVQEFTPLQGADMAATESYWSAIEWIKNGANAKARAHLEAYLASIKAEALILDRDAISEMIENQRKLAR